MFVCASSKRKKNIAEIICNYHFVLVESLLFLKGKMKTREERKGNNRKSKTNTHLYANVFCANNEHRSIVVNGLHVDV